MNQSYVARRSEPVATAWQYGKVLSLAGLLGLSLQLGGCESRNSASMIDSQQPAATDSPEVELRRRAGLRFELATGYLEQGKLEVALDEVNQSLAIDPRFVDAIVLRGLVYFRMDDLMAAEQSFNRALAMSPSDGGALHNMGLLRCHQRSYLQAQSFFDRALAVPRYKDKGTTWLTQGVCQLRSGDRAAAEVSLLRAFEFNPSNPIALFNLSKLQFAKADYTRARYYLQRLHSLNLANAESLHLGILVERRLGNIDGVRKLQSELRAKFPQSNQMLRIDKGDFNE
jgi:type IV pilus assembly protein PilF